jgi:DNA-binding MarR family transcriptional regulator
MQLHCDVESQPMRVEDLPTDPIVAAWVAIVRASNGLIAAVAADGKAAGFPPLEWYDVLWELERKSPKRGLRPFELEHGLLIAQYNISRLVDRMCQAGYIERRPCDSDARGQVLVITDKGRTVRKKMWPVYLASIQRHIASHLSADDARALCALLVRVVKSQGQEESDPDKRKQR